MSIESEIKMLQNKAQKEERSFEAEDILNFASTNPKSALWEDYDKRNLWDDSYAAHTARLHHAQYILQHYVYVLHDHGELRTIRKLVHIRPAYGGGSGYAPTEDFLNSPAKRASLIHEVVNRAMSMLKHYPIEAECKPIYMACYKVLKAYPLAAGTETHQDGKAPSSSKDDHAGSHP